MKPLKLSQYERKYSFIVSLFVAGATKVTKFIAKYWGFFFLIMLDAVGFLVTYSYRPKHLILEPQFKSAIGPDIASFIFRYFAALLFFLFLYVFLVRSVQKKLRNIFQTLWTIVILVFLAIRTPQIFQDLGAINNYFSAHASAFLIGLYFISCFFVLLIVFLFQDKNENRAVRFFVKSLLVFWLVNQVWLLNFFQSNSLQDHSGSKLKTTWHPKTVVILSVDSIGQEDLRLLKTYASPKLKRFLEEALQFKEVVTPVAQTHVSLSAFLSGQTPVENQIRNAFAYQSLSKNTHFLLLDNLKNAGYQTSIIFDTHETNVFQKNKSIDDFFGPTPNANNAIVSRYFYSKFFHGLFQNFMGRLFLPEIFENGSFFFSYNSKNVVSRIQQQITQKLEQNERPQFVFVHFCGPKHIPIILPYPYYPRQDFRKNANAKFTLWPYYPGPNRNPKDKMSLEYRRLVSESGTEYMAKEILNPLFEWLDDIGYLSNGQIALMSDHGEYIPDANLDLPADKRVYHGKSLLFDSRDEFPLFLFKGSKEKTNLSEAVSLSHVLEKTGWFSDILKNTTQSVSAETGFLPFLSFAGQWSWTKGKFLTQYMRYDSQKGIMFFDKKSVPLFNFDKQRSIYFEGNRWTVFPTTRGFQIFVCQYKIDLKCSFNLYDKLSTKQRLAAFEVWQKSFSNDKDLGAAAEAKSFDEFNSRQIAKKMMLSQNISERLLGAWILYYRYFEFDASLAFILKEIENNKNISTFDFLIERLSEECFYFGDANLLNKFYWLIAQQRPAYLSRPNSCVFEDINSKLQYYREKMSKLSLNDISIDGFRSLGLALEEKTKFNTLQILLQQNTSKIDKTKLAQMVKMSVHSLFQQQNEYQLTLEKEFSDIIYFDLVYAIDKKIADKVIIEKIKSEISTPLVEYLYFSKIIGPLSPDSFAKLGDREKMRARFAVHLERGLK